MRSSRAGPGGRQRAFKGAVAGRERRKATVTGYCFATQPLVEVRLFRDHRDQGEFIDMTVPQAREMIRLILDAIEGAANLARHDGSFNADVSGRAPLAEDAAHVGHRAEA